MKWRRTTSGTCVGIPSAVLLTDIHSPYIFGLERAKTKGFGLVKLGTYKSVYFSKDALGVFSVLHWSCANSIRSSI